MSEDVAVSQMAGIQGWFSVAEARVLYQRTVEAIGKHPDAAVVEIGSYHGRSTVVLALAAIDAHPNLKVVAIDPHEGNLTGLEMNPSWEAFNRNLKEVGVDGMVVPIRERSCFVDWAGQISMLFIDGLHDRTSVLADYCRFQKFVQPGGFIAFHDYSNPDYPGVRSVVDELVASGELTMVSAPSGTDPYDTLVITMKPVQLSIIIPTCGRFRLRRTLESLVANGALLTDDVIIVGDGWQPHARGIAADFPKDQLTIRYFEHGPTNMVGASQRNFAMTQATGTHIWCLDDDDEAAEGAVVAIREALAVNPNRPHVFREESRNTRHTWGVVWKEKEIRSGNVGTQGIIVPNVPERLGRFGQHYCGDYDFARSTVDLYPNKDADVVWIDKIVAYLY